MNHEAGEALRFLSGIENGNLNANQAGAIATKRDPILVYFLIRYLREKYPASNPASQGVIERLVEVTNTYPELVKASKMGERDAMREWFDDTYSMHEFFDKDETFIELIVDKLES